MDRLTAATSERFGYMWAERTTPILSPVRYHLETMRENLGAPPLAGRVLDAGCGEGIDLGSIALEASVRPVGLELSTGGSRTSRARAPRAAVIQGDLRFLPFCDAAFDCIYSYGVIHHTTDPAGVVRELTRALKPGGMLLVYLYEDFADRSLLWRSGLQATRFVRHVTTRLPAKVLMALCRVVGPLVFAACTWPSRHFGWAKRWPYRHCPTPASVAPDLYDRLAAPLEYRYSRETAAQLLASAGLTIRAIAQDRGWMLWTEKPA
jgi:SAM-dependent methyltransferase